MQTLIKRLKEYRLKHQQQYEKTLALWRKDFAAAIDVNNLEKFPKALTELSQNLPVNYLDQYDEAIATPFFIEEPGLGCWVQTADEAVLQQGERRPATRYALHIPSETWYQEPLDAAIVTAFVVAARGIGLRQVSRATGFWTLGSGLLQREPLHIAWSDEAVNLHLLRALARRILHKGEQEAVAIEVAGSVEVVRI